MSFTWQNGRQLSGAQTSEELISYSYNADGIRTRKLRANGETTDYYLNGSNIITQITKSIVNPDNTVRLDFTYDENSSLLGFAYGGQDYWYVRNGQGDIIGILDKDGNEVVSYTYDSWGAPTSTTGSLAETIGQLNPFRYRGYYFDAELGLYYLNSRYYDPEIGRFISIDDQELLMDHADGLYDKNLFAYCDNSPIRRIDSDGEFWHIVVGGVIGAVSGAISNIVSTVASGEKLDWRKLLVDTAVGAAGGALTAAGFGAVAGGLVSGAGELAKQAIDGKFDAKKLAVSVAVGSIASKIGGTPKVSGQGNYAKSVVKQTTKRISNTVKHSTGAAARKGVKNAISYGVKNSLSSKLGKDLFNVLAKSGGASLGLTMSQALNYRLMGLL